MNDAERLIAEVNRFPSDYRRDLAAGLGLASVFVDTDRLERVWQLARALPQEWRRDFQQGMAFAFVARKMNHPEYFAECLARLPAAQAAGVRVAVQRCDEIEAELRGHAVRQAYRLWREKLAEWLDRNLVFPLEAPADLGECEPLCRAVSA